MPYCTNCGDNIPMSVNVVTDGGRTERKEVEYCPVCGAGVG